MQVTITEAVKKDNGWYEGKTDTGLDLSTKKPELGQILLACRGQRADIEISTKVNGNFTNNYLDEISPANPTEAPLPGSGNYVKGKEAPETQRAIAAAVALKEAVNTANHTVRPDMTAKEVSEKVLPLASSYFHWLLWRSGLGTEEDIPF